jgi:hypothetical protein
MDVKTIKLIYSHTDGLTNRTWIGRWRLVAESAQSWPLCTL